MADLMGKQWNVPISFTSLIGREQELEAVCALLSQPSVRLLTLHGPGGIGKTRLAIALANPLQNRFPDGIAFISLAPIREPERVLPVIAQELGIQAHAGVPLLEQFQAVLRNKHLLLILDNLEQVIAAAPLLETFLATCPHIKLVVTSRMLLHIPGEQVFPVPPLAVPHLAPLPEKEVLLHYAAVALYVQQARARRPDFQLTTTNASAIAEVCVHLDGLPLALELAAAHVSLLSPQALQARLPQRLQLLTRSTQGAPERLQSLQKMLDWSYELLSEKDQQLFRRLSVFRGGCTLQAAAVVCMGADDLEREVLERTDALLSQSMLQYVEQPDGEARLVLLETMREYGWECLIERRELENVRQAHAAYYLKLVEEAWPELSASRQEKLWLDRLEHDYENLRTAMQWFLAQGERGQSMEPALRLGAALERYWLPRGFGQEEQSFLKRALSRSAGAAADVQANALYSAGHLALHAGDIERTAILAQENLSFCREQRDTPGTARALYLLGNVALERNNPAGALACFQESFVLRKELGDEEGRAWSLLDLAYAHRAVGNYPEAQTSLEESLTIFHQRGHRRGKARVLDLLGQMTFALGDLVKAQRLFEEGLALFQELGIQRGMWSSHDHLGRIALALGNVRVARMHAEENRGLVRKLTGQDSPESLWLLAKVEAAQENNVTTYAFYKQLLALGREQEDKRAICWALDGLARLAMVQSNPAWATRLWGKAEALQEALVMPDFSDKHPPSGRVIGRLGVDPRPTPIEIMEQASYERLVETARTQLKEKFPILWAEGRTMIVDHVLADREPTASPLKKKKLSPRELEVLRLVAQDLTNKEIAEQLTITVATVNSQVASIFNKLEVKSRGAAIRYAIDHYLI